MGCTSSKPKRTKSLDDVQAGIKSSAANGQITKEDSNIKKVAAGEQQQGTNPIQIPGANKSFLAPDGIPFIDEDVEEEDVRLRSGKGDVNKNTKVEEEMNAKNSALIGRDAAFDRKSDVRETINSKEAVSIPLPQVSPVKTDTSRKEEEEAAVKIQAHMRGFMDRKKVRAIKQHNSAPAEKEEEEEEVHEQPAQPAATPSKYDENAAATKIQANFKGYKTRKQLRVGGN